MSETFDFDEGQYEAFKKSLEQDFIKILDEMDGGYSGARTSVVQVEAEYLGKTHIEKGRYILKVCLSKQAEQEVEKHKAAKVSSILGAYVPELIEPPIRYDELGIALTGILYQIAGESLLTMTTLRESLQQRLFRSSQRIEKLASIILDWNLQTQTSINPSDLLGIILQGVGEMHLIELEKSFQGISEHPRIDLTTLHAPMHNPIYFLHNLETYAQTSLRQMVYAIPKGVLHRDLHPGNVIVSNEGQSKKAFYLIDFASSCSGNALFDLAYLELSILLNSRGGFDRMHDVEKWWDLEQHLLSAPLPLERKFQGDSREDLQRVLPIRRALDIRIKQEKRKDDYWIAFLTASIEAGLDLARKVYRDRSLQRVAFLTAVSRFNYLIKLLGAKIPNTGSVGIIDWPSEKSTNDTAEKGGVAPILSASFVQERKAKIELVWPEEITQRAALYDPWKIIDGIWDKLTGESDQGVLLIGERVFGKSSFFNCVNGLFPREEGDLRAIRFDTWETRYSARSFASELLMKIHQSVGLMDSPVFESPSKDFNIDIFLSACQAVVNKKEGMRFVICIDEIDSIIAKAKSKEDARLILQLLFRLLTDPHLSIRLLLTANGKEILSRYRSGIGFMRKLGTWRIPLCSEGEMRELIELFDLPITFEKDALSRIFHYSGGQIYFVKFIVKLVVEVSKVQDDRKQIINAQRVDNLMREVITPTSTTSFPIRNIHGSVFETMKDIYPLFFSKEEQQFMRSLTETHGILRASSLQVGEAQLAAIANGLYERGYISRVRTDEGEEYSWRIGIWQLFLEDYYLLKYQQRHGKQ